MSHFMVAVLIPGDTKRENVESAIAQLLEPYSESKEVPDYLRDCWCINSIARRDSRDAEEKEFGDFGNIREQYRINVETKTIKDTDESWQKFTRIDEREAFSDAFQKKHPMYNKPDPKCVECKGTGKYLSTYNPISKWDWWQIGGRWTGAFDKNYKPDKDPDNQEVCLLCGGTGFRDDVVAIKTRIKDPDFKCNGCTNGIATKWPTQWKSFSGDIMPVWKIEKLECFAIVTPDGKWHERGEMGWFGIVTDEKEKISWEAEIIALTAEHKDCLAVCVDCHI